MMADRLDIRNILIFSWDPLDISDNKNLHDEYDDVLDKIISIGTSSDYENKIYNLLLAAEVDFEIDPINYDRIKSVANAIAQLVKLK